MGEVAEVLPCREIIGDLPRIEFVLQGHLHRIASKGHRPKSCDLGVDASDPANHEVRSCQVKQGRKD